MKSSAAEIVRQYFEKYVFISSLKIKKNKYEDGELARMALSIAYDIIHEMEHLIRSNHADDIEIIKQYLRQQVGLMHQILKKRQPLIISWFKRTSLPPDFGTCIHEAWFKLQHVEKKNQDPSVRTE